MPEKTKKGVCRILELYYLRRCRLHLIQLHRLLEGYDDGVDELIHDLEIEQDDGAAVNEDEFER